MTGTDHSWMRAAIALSRRCPPAAGAYSVGAIVVSGDGSELASGYSRDTGFRWHAEESALARVPLSEPRLAASTLYTTLEPCTQRRHSPRSCSSLILASGIRRVVIAWREPDLFVADCQGVESLRRAGVSVLEIPALAAEARAVNAHLNW